VVDLVADRWAEEMSGDLIRVFEAEDPAKAGSQFEPCRRRGRAGHLSLRESHQPSPAFLPTLSTPHRTSPVSSLSVERVKLYF